MTTANIVDYKFHGLKEIGTVLRCQMFLRLLYVGLFLVFHNPIRAGFIGL
jgi:hypothetical protein